MRAATAKNDLAASAAILNQAAQRRVARELSWYATLDPEVRKQVSLVTQAGINSFVKWYASAPSGTPSPPGGTQPPPSGTANQATRSERAPYQVSAIFDAAPRELTNSFSLQQTLALVRVIVDAVEEAEDALPGTKIEIREAVLQYSRDVAFSAAEIYAAAAETRGAADARLEALAVDSLVRGAGLEEMRSRAGVLGWSGKGDTVVVVGKAGPSFTESDARELRRAARRHASDALVGIQDGRVILVLGGASDPLKVVSGLLPRFEPGAVVIGPAVPSIGEAGPAATAALSAFAACAGWPEAPRPAYASDLLPERALLGDDTAKAALVATCYQPLAAAGPGVLETLSAYLDTGRSIEGAARSINAHTNTVRSRLKKVTELTGFDPQIPRDSFVLQIALTLARLAT
ncbi:MAG: helix-turn-helix domain-containing protein [Cellulomonadaceae bacterium]|jgi:hypothetical protein|nr:helix-turn-helix domain-containing protein [Cellulomonadaceae bacterium]